MKRINDGIGNNTIRYELGSNEIGKVCRSKLEQSLLVAGFTVEGSNVYSTDFWAMLDFKPLVATFTEQGDVTQFNVHHTDYWQREKNREEKYGSKITEVPHSVLLGLSDDLLRIIMKLNNSQTL